MPPLHKARFRFMIELTNAHAAQRDHFPGSASCDMALSAMAAVSCGRVGWCRRGSRRGEAFYLTAELCHHADLRLVPGV